MSDETGTMDVVEGLKRDTHEVWCLGEGCCHWLQPEEIRELLANLQANTVLSCPAGQWLTKSQVKIIAARYRQSFVKDTSRAGAKGIGRPRVPQPCPKCGEPCGGRLEAERHCSKKMVQERQKQAIEQIKQVGKENLNG